ncbi:ABC transporter substrate-binding protein [Kamptonema cortianum]|nr:ABC transporter substrate-binding protein [Oscillatoria laete-virens]MDK3159919.1 ABC transporter substrate-binding protein [Kamptonema cortianum]MDL5050512.1 ABC transporter substrate-binding protein [Oscillatoria amoena NRMC-F 0135]MDL5055524.1 ABC transporter substrate-binding protein [Oscillatoria laete-virens NRMC-F 0139]
MSRLTFSFHAKPVSQRAGAILSILLLGLLALSGGCSKSSDGKGKEAGDILIGHFASMTGSTATFGQSTDRGIRMAAEAINARGGVLGGRKIVVITEDNQGKPDEAVNAALKLINQNRVSALLGEVASSRSLAVAPIAQQARVPMLTPSSTNPKVTEVGDFIFRSCFIDPFQGSAMASFAVNDLGLKKFAVFTDIKNDYSTGLAKFFKDKVVELGGEIVADESYSEGDVDFRAQLTSIRSKNPDAIFIPGYYTEFGLIARQARALGITVPFLGGDGWDSDKTYEIGGDAINGGYYSNHYSPEDQRPEVVAFIEEYRSRYGSTPDAMAVLGYDAMLMMADAIERAGSADRQSIRDALAATKDFKGVAGHITMDEGRNALKPLVVLKIEDGKSKFVKQIEP